METDNQDNNLRHYYVAKLIWRNGKEELTQWNGLEVINAFPDQLVIKQTTFFLDRSTIRILGNVHYCNYTQYYSYSVL